MPKENPKEIPYAKKIRIKKKSSGNKDGNGEGKSKGNPKENFEGMSKDNSEKISGQL